MTRNLLSVELQNEPFPDGRIDELSARAVKHLKISRDQAGYYVFSGTVSNRTYVPDSPEVMILLKNGSTADITEVSDLFEHKLLSERITKYYLCYPKEIKQQ